MTPPSISIVGGGFSGTLLAVQLARHAERPLQVTLYDGQAAFARGVAYGTRAPEHLLNVRADRMGAFPDAPDDFHRWLVETGNAWRARHPALAGIQAGPADFLPRLLYGDYLESLLEQARANGRGVQIETVAAQVIDVAFEADAAILTLSDGSRPRADRVVLALGSLGAQDHGFGDAVRNSPHYTGNIWQPPEGSLLTRSDFTPEDSPTLIIGSGLTTIDAILSLKRKGYAGDLFVLSRHGLWPRPHVAEETPLSPCVTVQTAPSSARALIRLVHGCARQTGADWRGVIDALRANTPGIWAGLAETERRKLLRALSFWNVSRHRMPPASHALLEEERQAGRLRMLAGRIERAQPAGERLQLHLRLGSGERRVQDVAHLLNCAGPPTCIDRMGQPLLTRLLERGAIQRGPLGMGIAADAESRVKNGLPARLFALGPLLVGERLETVAVPELRQQAERLAHTLLRTFD